MPCPRVRCHFQSLGLAITPKVKISNTSRSDNATKAKNLPRALTILQDKLKKEKSKKNKASSDSDSDSDDDSDDDSDSDGSGDSSDGDSDSSDGDDSTSDGDDSDGSSDSDSGDSDDDILRPVADQVSASASWECSTI